MTCPTCARDNPAAARFCGDCGTRLEAICPACQTPNPPANRFCHDCGGALLSAERFVSPRAYTPRHLAEKILTTGSALAGERKQVTVLFVDVSGFTSLSERLDPEEVHRLMSGAFDLMLAEVHRYEGTVNQFLGDGIMALFGAPIAHEDHARRAVHAALGITRALAAYQAELAPRSISFRARQGLNTGLVVVGSIGSDLRMDYTAVGDTTNVAARLQQVSEPGRVTISGATHRLVHGYFETRSLGEIHLKGKADPVAAWEVTAAREARTRLEVEADRGLTPFVGRERELGLLLTAYDLARAGQGQVAFLVGEAGIGKSRLLHELRRRVDDGAAWLEGHCLSFGKAMTLHPLVDLVRRWFSIGQGDGEPEIAAKIHAALAVMGDDLATVAPYLRVLLSVDPASADVREMSPVQRRGETFEALRRLIARASAQRPLVLVVEDLHWIDDASEAFLAALLDTVPALRALLVFTYRPGYRNPFGERSYATRIVPETLSSEESARVAAAVLAIDALPGELRGLVGAKAEGNPFYAEELVKALQESGVLRPAAEGYQLARPISQVAVPATINDVIAARIDRLEETPKRILQVAAVIGREFTRRLVDRLAEVGEQTPESLRELTALELIHERRVFPELMYMFKHALTQDVAYASLLVERRKALHRLVGLAIEELYADRLPEHYEMLAHHFLKAEDLERALDYLLKAAAKATQAFGLRQAVDLHAEALGVADRLGERVPPHTTMAIHRACADAFFQLGDFHRSREAAEALVAFARRAEDRAAEAGALVQLASALQWAEDFPAARGAAQRAIEIAESARAQGPLSGGLFVRGYVEAVSGELDAAVSDLGRSVEIARTANDPGREALALNLLGHRRSWEGAYAESLALNARAVALARQHHLTLPLLRSLWTCGISSSELGDYDAALAAFAECLLLAEKIGDEAGIPRLTNTLGWLRIDCGDFGRGIELSERAYEFTTRSSRAGHGTGAERRAFIRNNQADAWVAQGDLANAAEALREALSIVERPPASRWMTWRYAAHCYLSLGQVALLRGDPERARRLADQSLEISVPTRSRKYESWAWRLKGESARARRAWGEAEDALRRARAIAESIGQPRLRWMSEAALGHLDGAQGRRGAARARYRAAWAIIADLRARTGDPGLRAGLESWPLVREVGDLARS